MKFSLWLEKRVRNQKTQTKMPRVKNGTERVVSDANMRISQMVGHGQYKTHGKAGKMNYKKDKGSRSEKNRLAITDQQ